MTTKRRYEDELSKAGIPELNRGKILVIINGPVGHEVLPEAGKYSNNIVEVVEWKNLDLASFPLIKDFHITIESRLTSFGKMEEKNNSEPFNSYLVTWIRFESFEYPREYLASIELYYANIETALAAKLSIFQDIPSTFESPYFDGDQGWEVYLFHKDEYTYVLSGTSGGYFPIWFKVQKQKYLDCIKELDVGMKREMKEIMRVNELDGIRGAIRRFISNASAALRVWWHYEDFKRYYPSGKMMATRIKNQVNIALVVTCLLVISAVYVAFVIF